MSDESRTLIIKLLQEKALLKVDVSNKTAEGFNALKKALVSLESDLKSSLKKAGTKDVQVSYLDKGEFEAEFNIADDTLVFLRHTNVFTFENNHEIWKTSYIQDDHSRSYCGKIYVYNFLSDSFRYNRENDVGYLIARIFINKENHFFVEGKRQLGFLYNDFANSIFDADNVMKVAESVMIYSLDFDPYTPPYDQLSQLTVREILDSSLRSKIATGKRLGFRFQADSTDML